MKLKEAIRILAEAEVDSPAHDAREIFRELGGVPTHLLIGGDTECNDPKVEKAIQRRKNREPLQYIIGKTYFYREVYKVSKDCLIPRSDSEILVEEAVKNLPSGARFADLCTGSGCIGISTLKNTADSYAYLLDISEDAIGIAKENAILNGVNTRCEFITADLFSKRSNFLPDGLDAILSNPPYIPKRVYDTLSEEVHHEPSIAFIADETGMIFYRCIIDAFGTKLKDSGFIAFEIGYDQGRDIEKTAADRGYSCEIIKDLSGNERVAILKKTV